MGKEWFHAGYHEWRRIMALIFLILLGSALASAQYSIRTVAGGGPPDGTPAIQVGMDPTAVALDSAGNLYIAAADQNRIFRLAPNGLLSTVAGNGARETNITESVPATGTGLLIAIGVVVDGAGNVYISEVGRIRKITPGGLIHTVAGAPPVTGVQLDVPYAIALDGAGNIYSAAWGRVQKVSANGTVSTIAGAGVTGFAGDGGPAINALFHGVSGVAVDSTGNILLADSLNHRIRRISTAGIITTIAGTGVEGFSGDGGLATAAMLNRPEKVAVDGAGNIYISDCFNYRVRKISTDGVIRTIAGIGFAGFYTDGPAVARSLGWPQGITVDGAGTVYIADLGSNSVRRVSTDGMMTRVAGNFTPGRSGDGGAATAAQLNHPVVVAFDPAGGYYIADDRNHSVRRVSSGGVISTIAGTGTCGYSNPGTAARDAMLCTPSGLAAGAGGTVYISQFSGSVVQKVSGGVISNFAGKDHQPGFSGDGGQAVDAQLAAPQGIAMDSAGNVYIADMLNHRVRKVAPNGIITTVAGNGTAGFSGDNGAAVNASLNLPYAVAVDHQSNLYIVEAGNLRVRKVSVAGVITTIAGNGTRAYGSDGLPATLAALNSPFGVAVDAAGDVYIAEEARIRKIAGGVLTTVAGTGAAKFAGDGGLAWLAGLHGGAGVAVNGEGAVYIADAYSNRIRVAAPPASVQPSALIFTSQVGNPRPSPQNVTFSNTFGNVTVTNISENWLVFRPSTQQVEISPAFNLPIGTYHSNIRFSTANGAIDLPVRWIVTDCTDAPSASSFSIPAGGGSEGFIVNAKTWCDWTATSSAPWITITSGTSGRGTNSLIFRVEANAGVARTGTINISGGYSIAVQQAGTIELPSGLRYFPILPCRAADTRTSASPRMTAGETRNFALPASNCGIPGNVAAYSLNVTVVPAGALSYVTLGPAGLPRPTVSTLNSFDGRIKSNAAIVPAGAGGAISVFVTDATDVVLDVNGYFAIEGAAPLAFYPLAPCRIADTRLTTPIAAGSTRGFTPAGSCGIPTTAQAYSLNLTAVPMSALGFLTVWPSGLARPLASTLNSPTGVVTANAAIVPAGISGGISVFATDTTNVVIDVNGYFAAAVSGASSFHTVAPCRVVDTRIAPGALGGPVMEGNQTRTFPLASSNCGLSESAKAYSLNVTVVPSGPLSYLTLWPAGGTQPLVSTLNAFDGSVVSNAAIVPAGTGGGVSVFVTNQAHVIVDVNGYFR